MSNNPKLQFDLNRPRLVSFNSNKPAATGEGQYGPWQLFEVVTGGAAYSFFPSDALFREIKPYFDNNIRTFIIEKIAKEVGGRVITSWRVADPKGTTPESKPASADSKFNAELNESVVEEKRMDKDEQIARSVALKAAIEYHAGKPAMRENIIEVAEFFLHWLTK